MLSCGFQLRSYSNRGFRSRCVSSLDTDLWSMALRNASRIRRLSESIAGVGRPLAPPAVGGGSLDVVRIYAGVANLIAFSQWVRHCTAWLLIRRTSAPSKVRFRLRAVFSGFSGLSRLSLLLSVQRQPLKPSFERQLGAHKYPSHRRAPLFTLFCRFWSILYRQPILVCATDVFDFILAPLGRPVFRMVHV
jgi:hypothetical protein